ncbi:hypothetical protein ABDK74_04885 [Gluconobacter sp. OJB]
MSWLSVVSGSLEIVPAKTTNSRISLHRFSALRAFFGVGGWTYRGVVNGFDAQDMHYSHNEKCHSIDKPREERSSFRVCYDADDTAQNNDDNQEEHGYNSRKLVFPSTLLDSNRNCESSATATGGRA